MSGAVNQLWELLVLEPVHNVERSLPRTRRRKGLRAICDCQTRCEGFTRTCTQLAIPTENPSNEETGIE